MEYNFEDDIKAIREIMELSQDQLADILEVERVTVSRTELNKTVASSRFIEKVYAYAFSNDIRINKLKEMLWSEKMKPGHKLLFHGAKSEINGRIRADIGREQNDFGQGFYAGESYDQSISYVSNYKESSVYLMDFQAKGLKCREYSVDRDWMLTVAYFRGGLNEYENHPYVRKLAKDARDSDYIIAPIADNRMFKIIDSFIGGEITEEQCKHCLAATNLGKQYVFLTEKSVSKLKIVDRCYISDNERKSYLDLRTQESKLGDDKVKLARIQYRGKGKYIDEIIGDL